MNNNLILTFGMFLLITSVVLSSIILIHTVGFYKEIVSMYKENCELKNGQWSEEDERYVCEIETQTHYYIKDIFSEMIP